MKKCAKILTLVLAIIVLGSTLTVKADLGYLYSHDNQPIYSTVGLSTTLDNIYTVISDGWTLQASNFTSPEDLYLYTDPDTNEETIYVVDSASNHLFVFDSDLKQTDEITQFPIYADDFDSASAALINTNDGTGKSTKFLTKNPEFTDKTSTDTFYVELCGVTGVYRAVRPIYGEDGFRIKGEYEDVLYLCDTTNQQIVIVDSHDYHVKQVISQPTSISFSGKTFKPTRVVTDTAGMMYVISQGVYEGIMQMTHDGEFSCYVGTNYTTLTFWEILWRNFQSQEQLEESASQIVSTSFLSLAMDDEGFIYATSGSNTTTSNKYMIKRINPSGDDVLTRNGYSFPVGDIVYVKTSTDSRVTVGASKFTAVAVNEYGMYTVADTNTGRLFTYDDQGYLLYISGGSGSELSDLTNPVAIAYQGDNLLVLDKGNRSIVRFKPTEVAEVINYASKLYYEGDLTGSADAWKQVVALNPNYEYAYIGIGKSLFYDGRYAEAMTNFEQGYEQSYYSKAYKYLRDEKIKTYLIPVALILLAAILFKVITNYIKKRKGPKQEESGMGDE